MCLEDMEDLSAEVECLKRQMQKQRDLTRNLYQFADCVSSPLWKRIKWWFMGFRFNRVGRWYGKDRSEGWPPSTRKQ